MSSQVSEIKGSRQSSLSDWIGEFGPPLPLFAILSCIPYAVVYFANLWALPHYQFFPLLLIAVVLLAKSRWGGRYQGGTVFRCFRILLLCGGMFGALCATAFASPWMGYFGFAFCAASWFAYHRDGETGRSLLYLAVPIVLVWQPPYNTIVTADTILIQTLQSLSAKLSSQWLDILGYAHHQPGTILEFAGKSFGVAEACSGIQSFFAVLCFGSLLVVYLRRGILHSALLLATSPCWAILMNTIRITAIPIAYSLLGIDLSHGLLHDMLGYCTMALALGLLLSSDELLLLVSRHLGFGGGSLLSRLVPVEQANKSHQSVFKPSFVVFPAILLFAGFFAIQSYDVSESWGRQKKAIDFFRDEPILNMSFADAPESLGGWPQTDYEPISRERDNDDLGQRSDVWRYNSPVGEATVSFDQMFPGWHELTRCYRAAGWHLDNRLVVDSSVSGEWPIVMAELTREGETGFLLWSLVTREGSYVTPPGQWNKWSSLYERLQNRLSPSVRGALFGIAAYQVQIFVPTNSPLSLEQRDETMVRFLNVRELLWAAAKQRL